MQYHLAAAMVAWQILILENLNDQRLAGAGRAAGVGRFVYRQYKIYLDAS